MNKSTILLSAAKVKAANPQLRWGQAVFNTTYEKAPEKANKLRGSEFDCFYNDNKVESFLNEVFK